MSKNKVEKITVDARASKFWNFVRTIEFWNFVRTSEFWNLVRTSEIWLFWWSWIFGLLALKMTLKTNSDNKFGIYGLCSISWQGFISSKALQRLCEMFVVLLSIGSARLPVNPKVCWRRGRKVDGSKAAQKAAAARYPRFDRETSRNAHRKLRDWQHWWHATLHRMTAGHHIECQRRT